jgi:hypothetical protein
MRQLVQAQTAPPQAAAARPPARGFGAAAPAAAAHDLSRVAVSAPVRRPLPGAAPIQRVIKVGGNVLADHEVAAHGTDAAERTILDNWSKSPVEHSFGEAGHLTEAVANVKGEPDDAPLYSAANLKFATKSANRLPTLYFKSGADSGRLRQQHPKGPKAGKETNKTDYFFGSEGDISAFHGAARKARRDKTAFDTSGLTHGTDPQDDAFHLEVTYGAGNKVTGLHRSEGKVATKVDDYDDEAVKSIYQKVIGRKA